MENEKLVREALGRVAYIGDLYDARSDSFCGIQIFKKTPPATTIRLIDNPFSDTQMVTSDKYSDKFSKLDIKAELKASIMAGLVKLEGSGRYFQDEKQSARAVRSDLIYNIQTKVEKINLFDEELKECFSFDALNVDSATHVVVEIYWGANSMVSMEYENSENTEKKQVEGALQAELSKMSSSLVSLDGAKAEVDVGWGDSKKSNNITFKIFADMVPSEEELPQTIEEVMAFMKKMPRLVHKSNDGKGKITYSYNSIIFETQKQLRIKKILRLKSTLILI
jgi:hypothetical protein